MTRRPFLRLAFLLPSLALLGCSGTRDLTQDHEAGGAGTADDAPNLRLGERAQTIDGFGFSTAWGSVPSEGNLDAFMSTTTGAGLTILRNRIPFREHPDMNDDFLGTGNYEYTTTGTGADATKTFRLNWGNWDLSTTRELIATIQANPDYQLTHVFSTPWTPPNNATSRWKSNVADYENRPEVGGSLDPDHYQDYADVLADYVLGFEENMGAPLDALSLQNEPNFECDYESADWTEQQFYDFSVVLKEQFTKKGVFEALPELTLMAPEHNTMDESLLVSTLDDPELSGLFGIVAGHQYDYGWSSAPFTVPAPNFATARREGKRLWMTEWSVERFLSIGGSFTNDDIQPSLALANAIHADLVDYELHAYIYWWSAALEHQGRPAKVLSALGQYSRFVRPGWVRIGTNPRPAPEVLLSAFTSPAEDQLAIVAVNLGNQSRTIPLWLDEKSFGTLTPTRTSATENLAPLEPIPGGTDTVEVTLPGQSITTFTTSL